MDGTPKEALNKSRYLKAKEASKFFGVSQDTLRRWNKLGLITSFRTNPVGGHRRYDIHSYKVPIVSPKLPEQTNTTKTTSETASTYSPATAPIVQTDNRKSVCYARVSSSQQKDDLERQVDSLKKLYPSYEIIKDVGSGINFKRRGFQQLLKEVFNGNIKEIVIAHRDRLCRFGFDLLQWIFDYHKTTLVVLDATKNDPNEDLCKDVLSLLHIFACRINGKRKYTKGEQFKINGKSKISPGGRKRVDEEKTKEEERKETS